MAVIFISLPTAVVLLAAVTAEGNCLPFDADADSTAPATPGPRGPLMQLEYSTYLKEVVQLIESEPEYQKLAERHDGSMKVDDITDYLNLASSNTRGKLDELKRIEIRRLKDLHKVAMQQAVASGKEELAQGYKRSKKELPKIDDGHLNAADPNKFTGEDLKQLVSKVTSDLADVDKIRRGNFKSYEMEKELKFRRGIRSLPEAEKRQRLEVHRKKLKNHAKLNHPGTKAQLEEVWKEVDKMDPSDFDPKVLFMLHDVDSDGLLNPYEIEALFVHEIRKLSNMSDIVEREEIMNRMREHIFTEVDTDRDGMVSLTELIKSTKTEEYQNDPGWQPQDEETFTEEELAEFSKSRGEILE